MYVNANTVLIENFLIRGIKLLPDIYTNVNVNSISMPLSSLVFLTLPSYW